uniref:Uncharacterized protein n=1 Tax=Oryza meridionalis TaxID=40149 RepID=A0A0E0EUZ5_9ORYZ
MDQHEGLEWQLVPTPGAEVPAPLPGAQTPFLLWRRRLPLTRLSASASSSSSEVEGGAGWRGS